MSSLLITNVKAEKKCICNGIDKRFKSLTELVKTLEKSDFKFAPTFETLSVRGVQSASYYYCDDEHGFLLVKLHDKELLYKDVPLNVWFEFKFANSLQSFYKDQIKYDFIAI